MKTAWIVLLLSLFPSCRPGREISIKSLPNYKPDVAKILFLDFAVRREGSGETVLLENAILGVGTMKAVSQAPAGQTVIRAALEDRSGKELSKWYVEHPLYRTVEVADPQTGSLRRQSLDELRGQFSLRFPYNDHLHQLVLYRVEPGSASRKLYTLRLKP